jgi:hypothetical protein
MWKPPEKTEFAMWKPPEKKGGCPNAHVNLQGKTGFTMQIVTRKHDLPRRPLGETGLATRYRICLAESRGKTGFTKQILTGKKTGFTMRICRGNRVCQADPH